MFGPIEIPNKSSFKINEVCALTGVKSYVLRFWESEFPEIAPIVSSSGQKLYEHKDIEAILFVKKLLFEDKLTIERAKAELHELMPRESLVESPFLESESVIYESSERPHLLVDEDESMIDVEVESNETFSSRETLVKRVLIESDFQKLMLAKNKLADILVMTKALQEKNNW